MPLSEPVLPPLAQLLTEDGDARIVPDAVTGRNRYGCVTVPQPDVLAFGSCTASPPSELAWHVTDQWRVDVVRRLATASVTSVRVAETAALEQHLLRLLGFCREVVDDADAVAVRLIASGTDAHRLAVGSFADTPVRVIMMAAHETGSGVPEAVQPVNGSVQMISVREADASLRPMYVVEREIEQSVQDAVQTGEQVLLVAIHGSKTGLQVPSPALLARLSQRFGEALRVLVDASQFRLEPATIHRYVQSGWLVVLTGSKFMAGPSFSGALLGNAGLMVRLPSVVPGFGVLARWQAAMVEMEAFFALDGKALRAILLELGERIVMLMQKSTILVPLPGYAPVSGASAGADSWDGLPTIFPFLLRDGHSEQYLSFRWASDCYRYLQQPDGTGKPSILLGQPVVCGVAPDGEPLAVLRLCLSAPLLVEAMRSGGDVVLRDVTRALAYVEAWGKKTGIRRCPEYRMEDEDRT